MGEEPVDHGSTDPTPPLPHEATTRPWQSMPSPSEEDDAGFPEWLAGYRRDRKLGHGGMGVVYRYRDTKLDRLVAVKRMPADVMHGDMQRELFEAEARTLAALDHPNIGKIYHVEEHDGLDHLILEYVPGRNLAHDLGDGPKEVGRVIEIGLQIGRAIEAGHSRGVVHRDIKPGNIMITPTGVAKLLDYGLARRSAGVGPDPAEIPGSGAEPRRRAVGTPGYMSPEQARGEEIDDRTDIWAFGCVLYEALSGRRAFPTREGEDRLAATLKGPPPWDALPADAPEPLRRLIEQCLEADRAQRPDAATACLVLERCLAAPTPRPTRIERPLPYNVPTSLSTFVRRMGENERLRQIIANARLVTLTGPGGSGKTRLACELCEEIVEDARNGIDASRFADGIWLVELASLTDPDRVPQAVLSVLESAFGPRGASSSTMIKGLLDTIGDRRLLLVLDNCEHLRDACRQMVETLLRECTQLCVLVTSREPIGVDGEQTYPVPALSFPPAIAPGDVAKYEAVRLFALRAAQARPTFAVTAGNAEAIAEICRRLEGIPLAIELAAARVGVMSVDQVAQRLFQVLDPARVIESSIEWSIKLLSTTQRTMLGRLSMFRGGWTLEAAEEVCADDDAGFLGGHSVIHLLTDLAARSLVLYEEREDRARYRLLETVRELCERRIMDGDGDGDGAAFVRRRHLGFFLTLAEDAEENFSRATQAAWLNRLETEHDNLRAAIRHSLESTDPDGAARLAIAMHMFWSVRGYHEEGRSWTELAVKRRDGHRDVMQVRLLNAAGTLANGQGDFERAYQRYQEALTIARELDDRPRIAGVLTNLGTVAEDQGRLADARRFQEESLAVYQELGNRFGVACAQLNLGDVAKIEGALDEAVRLFTDGLAVFRAENDKQRIAAALHNLGQVVYLRGEHAAAAERFREALTLRSELRDPRATAGTLLWCGILCMQNDRYERSATLFGAAEAMRAGVEASVANFDVVDYGRAFGKVREHLGAARLDRSWAVGSSMTFDQAVAFALDQSDDDAGADTSMWLIPEDSG
jgi:non-specific serine/threonine protein kinase